MFNYSKFLFLLVLDKGYGNAEDLKRREEKLAEQERKLKVEMEFVENERNRI
jgi:hypothetical protein